MSDVFISYARENLPEARGLAEALHDRGLSVFWDRTIPPGHQFEDAIETAIRDSRVVVVLWSRHSIRSDWVRAEASEGASRGILVPVTLDGAPPPMRYRVTQTADLSDWMPGRTTESFAVFLDHVAKAARTPQAIPAIRHGAIVRGRDTWIRHSLRASTACAWAGSLGLAVTLAYDYKVVTRVGTIYVIAYFLAMWALALGAVASVTLGALSLKRQFLVGILQGWVWPVVGAVGQVAILIFAAQLIRQLPFLSEFEGLLVFVLCGAIAPGVLTIGAVIANRALAQGR